MLGALLVATAALLTYLAAARSDQRPTTGYVVAAHDHAPGRILAPGDLAVVTMELPAQQAATVYGDPAPLVGAVLRGPVAAGALLSATLVEPAADGTTVERFREVSFSLPRARALLGNLQPGDRVDVLATVDERTAVLVQQALVLGASGSGGDGLVVSDDVVVTLALPDGADALALAHGAAVAELTVLRSTRAVDELPASMPPVAAATTTPGGAEATGAPS